MSNYKPLDYISVLDAINLLATYDMRPSDTPRLAKDRTRQLITKHINKNVLKLTNNKLHFGRLISWAREQSSFKNKLNNLPVLEDLKANLSVKCSLTAELF